MRLKYGVMTLAVAFFSLNSPFAEALTEDLLTRVYCDTDNMFYTRVSVEADKADSLIDNLEEQTTFKTKCVDNEYTDLFQVVCQVGRVPMLVYTDEGGWDDNKFKECIEGHTSTDPVMFFITMHKDESAAK